MTDRARSFNRIRGLALGGLAALLLAGCAAELQSDRAKLEEARLAYVAANPDLDARTIDAIKAGELVIGMAPAEVAASWGQPYRINTFSDGRLEEWVFGCDYPHYCVSRDRRGKFTAGLLFDNVVYMSKAYFTAGRLSEWTQ